VCNGCNGSARVMPAAGTPAKQASGREGSEEASASSGKARLVVRVPADARLWVDRVECPLPGTVRAFETPELNPQQSYSYTLRVAVQRDGQTVEDSRRVEFASGQQVEVDLSNIGAVRTAAR